MSIVEVHELSAFRSPHGVIARDLEAIDRAQVVQIELEPGQRLRRHMAALDVFFYVLEGDATVEIGQERRSVPAGGLLYGPADTPHLVANEGGTRMRFLVVKTPDLSGCM